MRKGSVPGVGGVLCNEADIYRAAREVYAVASDVVTPGPNLLFEV